ncbi:GMC family oxidoreductase N-terminal domain-containing protein [Sphingomonas aurantiaca]|uniref:GMC family oxidoreductase N-terminal domain-containing protein n=1 Tax=Sphingomonas aurantiaca TaxID=185949 RepID=UPI002FE3B2EE
MIYTRGHPQDYDEWRQMGLPGWSFDDVLPYFKRLEGHHRGDCDLHGGGGPLTISGGESDSPFYDALVEAGRQAGYPVTEDFNGTSQEGFGRYDLTVADGKRWSTAAAYLRPVLARRNLTCVTGARTTRIRIDKGRAVGVDYVLDKGGRAESVMATREVLLCAGAVQSPQILQLSGIGDPDRLTAAGIGVVHALPGVGENLQDHLDVVMNWTSRGLRTGYAITKGISMLGVGLNYMLRGKGRGGSNSSRRARSCRRARGCRAPTSRSTRCSRSCRITARSRRPRMASRCICASCGRKAGGGSGSPRRIRSPIR